MQRSTIEVFQSHLQLRMNKKVEEDLAQNFSPDVVLLTMDGEFSGHDGVRQSNKLLEKRTTGATYHYLHQSVQGEMAFLVWSAVEDETEVYRGADSFLIKKRKGCYPDYLLSVS